MDNSFCISALQEALERFVWPKILNTDRAANSSALRSLACYAAGVRISFRASSTQNAIKFDNTKIFRSSYCK